MLCQVDTGASLNGAWTDWNLRVLFDAVDISAYLQPGSNAIGVRVGTGWHNSTTFPQKRSPSACDVHQRMLRAVLEADEAVVAGTNTAWIMSDGGPVLMDSVYNGETFDARLDSRAWTKPGFTPTKGWRNASHIDCFNPTMSPRTFPSISVMEERPPVNINRIQPCPANKVPLLHMGRPSERARGHERESM